MSPYGKLPAHHFWRLAVANKNPLDIGGLWRPKFSLEKRDPVATYGSCFAQHIGRALIDNGYNWLNAETPPGQLSENNCRLFNYSIFSARTQNIYTTTMLEQWIDWSLGLKDVPDEVWESGGRYYDPFRPTVEPNGFASAGEMISSRKYLLECFKSSIETARVVVFTLGLTERWINKHYGYEYSTCPGTTVGAYDQSAHIFKNLTFPDVQSSLTSALDKIMEINKDIKVLLTVSPVPLTATYLDRHVLISTMESKSTLRSAAGFLAANRANVDYFPSYEMISSFPFKGMFFEPNVRTVSKHGVDFVMREFFNALENGQSNQNPVPVHTPGKSRSMDVICEEELLDAFAK